VAATVEAPEGPADIGTGLDAEGTRRVRINGANARAIEDLSAYVRVLWLTPAMDGLFTGPASERRRFLDRLVTTLVPSHSTAVNDYEKAMRQRNRLLEDDADPLWIGAVEAEMAAQAAAVHFARLDTLAQLQRLIAEGVDDRRFPAARLELTPPAEGMAEPGASAALEAALRRRWAETRALDRTARRTTEGPHRIDLAVFYAQKQMPAALGSTGEQKALLVGLVLAHARLVKRAAGITPFLLLDEIAAHLDPDRRAALFDTIDGLGSQCFMTGTDALLFAALGARAQHVTVRDGRLATVAEN
jgi:DNA replication and repair protein RecF